MTRLASYSHGLSGTVDVASNLLSTIEYYNKVQISRSWNLERQHV